jgi:hypothetical protein
MKSAGNIRRGLHDDERSFWLNLAICCEFGLEESLFLPPGIPCGFDSGRVVGFVLRVFEGFDN